VEWNHGTGEAKHRLQMKLPPEEEFESFAARLRPFVMRKESVYWAVVLDALEKLLSEETLADLVDMQTLREYWSEVVKGSQVAAGVLRNDRQRPALRCSVGRLVAEF
jgi:hypothetical protein